MRKLVCENYSKRTRTQKRTARKGTRIGEQDQSSLDRTVRRGQNSQTGQPRRIGQPEQDNQERAGDGAGRTGQGTARTEAPEQNCQNRTPRTRKPQQNSEERTVRTGAVGNPEVFRTRRWELIFNKYKIHFQPSLRKICSSKMKIHYWFSIKKRIQTEVVGSIRSASRRQLEGRLRSHTS
jgi:hypothetical protein